MAQIKCNQCNKEFKALESLEQHIKAAHQNADKKPKISYKKYFLIFGFILAILIITTAFIIRASQPGKYDSFAQCLTEKGAVIYGNDFCSYTNKQLNMFGRSAKYLDYIKCFDNKGLCDSKNIDITPTWEINRQFLKQVQPFDKLSKISGCEI